MLWMQEQGLSTNVFVFCNFSQSGSQFSRTGSGPFKKKSVRSGSKVCTTLYDVVVSLGAEMSHENGNEIDYCTKIHNS